METEREGKFYRVRTNEGIDIGRACIEQSGSGFLVMEAFPGVVLRLEPKAVDEQWRKPVVKPELNCCTQEDVQVEES